MGIALGSASPAFGHATLVGSSPEDYSILPVQPSRVVFVFDQPVASPFAVIRIYGVHGRVDDGRLVHEAGPFKLSLGLRAGLATGSYLATYRVASEDGHIASGSIVFSVRRRGDVLSLARLRQSLGTGSSVNAVSIAARTLDDLAIAVAIGVPLFVVLIWLPAANGGGRTIAQSRERFEHAALVLVAACGGLGVASNAVAIAAQVAVEANVSFWAALDPARISAILATRIGAVSGIRAGLFAALTSVGVTLARRARTNVAMPKALLAAVALPTLAFLAVSPALAGHPSTQRPTAVLIPLDLIHVSAMSLWLGGLLALIALVPYALRGVAQDQRAAPLAAVVSRFSRLALAAVVALGLSGAIQGLLLIRSSHAVIHTDYGRAVVAKSCLLMALIALGVVSRHRALPAIRLAAAAADLQGTRILARVGRLELALLAGVLIAAALLASYAPPVTRSFSPYLATTRLGDAGMQLTVEPARTGVNQMDVYLLGRGGRPYAGVYELDMEVDLPARGIGPLPVTARPAGPGHFVIDDGIELVPAGRWRIRIHAQSSTGVSSTAVTVPIR